MIQDLQWVARWIWWPDHLVPSHLRGPQAISTPSLTQFQRPRAHVTDRPAFSVFARRKIPAKKFKQHNRLAYMNCSCHTEPPAHKSLLPAASVELETPLKVLDFLWFPYSQWYARLSIPSRSHMFADQGRGPYYVMRVRFCLIPVFSTRSRGSTKLVRLNTISVMKILFET